MTLRQRLPAVGLCLLLIGAIVLGAGTAIWMQAMRAQMGLP